MIPFSGVVEVDEYYGCLYEVAFDVYQKEFRQEYGEDTDIDTLIIALYDAADCDTEDVLSNSQGTKVWLTRSGMIKTAMAADEEAERVNCIKVMRDLGISLTLNEELEIVFH